jgi:cation-transporting ATPase F
MVLTDDFVVVKPAYLVNSRSPTKSVLQIGPFSNPPLFAGMATMVALQMVFTYTPFFHLTFSSAPIDLAAWLRIISVAVVVSLAVAVAKVLRRRLREPVPT